MTLGSYQAWLTHGTGRQLVEVKDEFVYVPLLQVLERMLQNDSIFEEVIITRHNLPFTWQSVQKVY